MNKNMKLLLQDGILATVMFAFYTFVWKESFKFTATSLGLDTMATNIWLAIAFGGTVIVAHILMDKILERFK